MQSINPRKNVVDAVKELKYSMELFSQEQPYVPQTLYFILGFSVLTGTQ